MPNRTATYAVILGVAAAVAWSATALAATKKKPVPGGVAQTPTYENQGSKQGMAPPVPGFAIASYKPGQCWKVRGADYQDGKWVPCTEFFKKK